MIPHLWRATGAFYCAAGWVRPAQGGRMDTGPEMETWDRCLRAKGQTSEFCSGVPAYGVGFTASLEHLAQEARALHPYQIEIANRIRGGRAVGTDYVVTRRPLGQTAILTRLPSREKAVAWIRARGGG